MITGWLRRKRVVIDNPGQASTLRNRGFLGKNSGETLSLDMVSSLYLLKKGKIKILSVKGEVGEREIEKMLGPEDKKRALAFQLLREKGLKTLVGASTVTHLNSKLFVFSSEEKIDFSKITGKSKKMVVVDTEGDGLLYVIEKLNMGRRKKRVVNNGKMNEKNEGIAYFLEMRGFRAASGLKYGCELRVYDKNSQHAKYLMSIGKKVALNEMIARVRIAHSVRKIFVQAVPQRKGQNFKLYSIKWIRI